MRRMRYLGATILVIGLAALPALSAQTRAKILSSTKAFSIDGKRFLLETSAGDDLSLISRELKKQGLDIQFDGPPSPLDSRFVDILRENGEPGPLPPLPLPHGLKAEHVMRMETSSGPIDLAFGTSDVPARTALDRLRASSWECVRADHGKGPAFMASMKKGRETFIVLLEEKERDFLFLRQVEE
ncbi:MAG: hypothetical protein HZA60_03615 [Deltaproteobacteria bacterium]|nr:hypothetical protein [Deltaproteobacteria bacterium]